jgi:hypothetical protein
MAIRDQFKQTMVGGEAVRMAEADWAFEESETTRAGEGGLVVRVQLRGLQPDPYPETAGAEHVKQRSQPSVAADGGRAESKTTKRAALRMIHKPRKRYFQQAPS